MKNENENPKEGRPTGLRRGGKVAYCQLLGSSNNGRRQVGRVCYRADGAQQKAGSWPCSPP